MGQQQESVGPGDGVQTPNRAVDDRDRRLYPDNAPVLVITPGHFNQGGEHYNGQNRAQRA